MGVDAHAYIDASYNPRELLKLFKALGEDFKWRPKPDITNGFGTFENEEHYIFYHPTSNDHLGQICLSGRTSSNAALLRQVVERLGGLFEESDSVGTMERISGLLSASDGIPYFYRWGVLQGIITDNHCISELHDAIETWHADMGSPMPRELSRNK